MDTDINYKKIALCQNFDELYTMLMEIGDIQGSSTIYTANKSIRSISLIRGGAVLNLITRTYGLRAKVAELIWYEQEGIL